MTLPLYSVADARAIDRFAIERLAIPGYVLMTRAATAALARLRGRWPHARRIGVLCGPGNNGGDGYRLALLAQAAGLAVEAIALADPAGVDACRARSDWLAAGGVVRPWEEGLPEVDLWVDALFGIGLARGLSGAAAAVVDALHATDRPVLALDVPSGVDADTGAVPGPAVRASATVEFIVGKRGLATGPALDHVGEHWLESLDLPAAAIDSAAPHALALSHADLPGMFGSDLACQSPTSTRSSSAVDACIHLPSRSRDSHKHRFGRVLCVGGDTGMAGAIALCAQAALRTGAGVVSVATRAGHVGPLLALQPELMVRGIEDGADFMSMAKAADLIAIGPGLGRGEWGRALWRAALASDRPLVIDADGLTLLAEHRHAVGDAVLTPHPGEAARLLACEPAAIQRDRFTAAAAIAEHYRATVVLKGAGSVVATPGARPRLIAAGNPGMAVAGMGDVLAGVIAALRGQGLAAFAAASAGALLHACAGDAAGRDGQRGLLPSDLLPWLRRLVNPIARSVP